MSVIGSILSGILSGAASFVTEHALASSAVGGALALFFGQKVVAKVKAWFAEVKQAVDEAAQKAEGVVKDVEQAAQNVVKKL